MASPGGAGAGAGYGDAVAIQSAALRRSTEGEARDAQVLSCLPGAKDATPDHGQLDPAVLTSMLIHQHANSIGNTKIPFSRGHNIPPPPCTHLPHVIQGKFMSTWASSEELNFEQKKVMLLNTG